MRLTTIFLFIIILTGCKTESQPDRPALAEQVTIYRDTWGVPHIAGDTDAATFFGIAYAIEAYFRDKVSFYLSDKLPDQKVDDKLGIINILSWHHKMTGLKPSEGQMIEAYISENVKILTTNQ